MNSVKKNSDKLFNDITESDVEEDEPTMESVKQKGPLRNKFGRFTKKELK